MGGFPGWSSLQILCLKSCCMLSAYLWHSVGKNIFIIRDLLVFWSTSFPAHILPWYNYYTSGILFCQRPARWSCNMWRRFRAKVRKSTVSRSSCCSPTLCWKVCCQRLGLFSHYNILTAIPSRRSGGGGEKGALRSDRVPCKLIIYLRKSGMQSNTNTQSSFFCCGIYFDFAGV